MQSKLAPIVLFVYNRPEHTRKTLEALKVNYLSPQSELIIYSDAAKDSSSVDKVEQVRKLIDITVGFKKITIVKQSENKGLAESIISGVTEVVNSYSKVIVLEDDLVTSPYFLTYMNDALDAYENEKKIASIHGYVYPIKNLPNSFFIKGADCWGWATWKDRWVIFEKDGEKLLKELEFRKLKKEADFNNSYEYSDMLRKQISGRNNSWAIRWYFSAFLNDMLTLYPGESFVQNIGHDFEATHCVTKTELFDVSLNEEYYFCKISVQESNDSREKFERFFKKIKPSFLKRVLSKIKRLLS